MSDHRPSGDDEIIESSAPTNPGTNDGVGEHVVEGPGHDGVGRMQDRFGDLDDADVESEASWPADATATGDNA